MSSHKNPSKSKKEYEDKTIGDIEGKEQLVESPKREDVREDEAEDLTPDSFTENVPDTSYGAETKGSEEIDDSLVDPRFSKSHEIDEASLRKSKKVDLSQETDEPADETPSE